jgi:hypothetical protein
MDHVGKGVPYVVAGVLVAFSLLLTTSMEKYAEPPVGAKEMPPSSPPQETSPVLEPTTPASTPAISKR